MLVYIYEREGLNFGNGRMFGKLVVYNLKENNFLVCENDGSDGIFFWKGMGWNVDVWIL